MTDYKQHPLSSAFPAMSDSEYTELSKSIEQIGLQNPIVLFDEMIIDGWHRYCACLDTGTAIKTIVLSESINPQEFVLAQNKERRHLTQSQIALAAIKVYEWLRDGVKAALQPSYAQYAQVKSSEELAKIAGVSTRTIVQAKQVEKQATTEMKAAVAKGEMSVATAVNKMSAPKKPQFNPDDYQPSQTEMDEAESEIIARESVMSELINSDDVQGDLIKLQIKQKAAYVILETRNNGLMNENASLIKIIKARDREIIRLKKIISDNQLNLKAA